MGRRIAPALASCAGQAALGGMPDEPEPPVRMVLAVAAGGACGALLRWWVAQGVHALLGRGFPYGTLVVNVSGSLVMGVLYVLFFERYDIAPEWRAALVVGLLSAFTAFSTFSMDTLLLIQQGEHARAGMNVVLSVVLCLAGCWLGIAAARQF